MTVTPSSLSWRNPWLRRVAIALIALIVLTLFLAPNTQRGSGSTFSRAPDGYGAWYAYMADRGTPLHQWQRPLSSLLEQPEGETTLVRIFSPPTFTGLTLDESNWLALGNRLVVLGLKSPATAAPFTTFLQTSTGQVRVDTTRRLTPAESDEVLLEDEFGAIALRSPIKEGDVIWINYPYFAANAYQNNEANYQFLADLVALPDHTLWVDEYLHGYQEEELIDEEFQSSWGIYLANTTLLPVAVQASVLILILLWASNQRFGAPVPLKSLEVNNSRAYIEALASVLHKAGSSEFVVDLIGQEEQLQIQRALGLGTTLVEPQELLEAWVNQTQRPAKELEQVLRPYWKKRRLNEPELIQWIQNIQTIHQHLSS